jgi:aminopeptidase N
MTKRLEYQPYPFDVPCVHLKFELKEETTHVTATSRFIRKPEFPDEPLVLNGRLVEFLGLQIDGKDVPAEQYELTDEALTIREVPDDFILEVKTAIHPEANDTGEGLYFKKGEFSTQCEPEGFRTMTYAPDRPDVLSVFTVEIVADKTKYPVLLSNPDLVSLTDNKDGTHTAIWHDPIPKPTYLFALVAGDLDYIEDKFITSPSKREVTIRVYAAKELIESGQCDYALACDKEAMKWDEDTFGREYDLNLFMTYVSPTFNMGAMENKGLNIFNTKYVCALPEIATDADFKRIKGVKGHEYFHNWSGDLVTVRDWFQLSLKEGFTVYRDQEFSRSFEGLPKVIEDVRLMRTKQFTEDAGPNAHPIRLNEAATPQNNYTVTIYEKGAEVVRMQEVILGKAGFRKGTDLYFSRHVGQAVTCEDFVKAMEDANGVDFTQFREWYNWAGTPVVAIETSYDGTNGELHMTVSQTCPPTPGQPEKPPFVIPFVIGFVGKNGDMKVEEKTGAYNPETGVLLLTKSKQEFLFRGFTEKPTLSLNRRFAPVRVKYDYREGELEFLAKHDLCAFSRWDAMQTLAKEVLVKLYHDAKTGKELDLDKRLWKVFEVVLTEKEIDLDLQAEMLKLPSEEEIANEIQEVDPIMVHKVREFAKEEITFILLEEFWDLYDDYHSEEGSSVAHRSVTNVVLDYLAKLNSSEEAENQFCSATNMTNKYAALVALVHNNRGDMQLANFYEAYKKYENVVCKWFAVQATNPNDGTLEKVKELLKHPSFDEKNPNIVRSLIGAFATANPAQFHALSGEGYKFFTDFLLGYDAMNPGVASRLVEAITDWKRYDKPRQKLLLAEILRLDANPKLSTETRDKVSKALRVFHEEYFA